MIRHALALALILLAVPLHAEEISGPMSPIPADDDPTQGYTFETKDDQPGMPVTYDVTQTAACGVMTGQDPAHANGIEAYRAGNYPEALILFMREAGQGNGQSAYMLGHMQAVGLILPQDQAAARAWFEQAVEQGSTAAEAELAVQQAYGLAGFQPDRAAAEARLAALVPDQPLAGFWLGKLRMGADPEGAIAPLKAAADSGHLPSIGLMIDSWCRAGKSASLTNESVLAYFAAAHVTLAHDPRGWAALPCADKLNAGAAQKAAALAEGQVIRARFQPQGIIW